MSDRVKIDHAMVRGRGETMWEVVRVSAVPTFLERIVPSAGEEHAWHFQHYRRVVEVSISPTGRSVRVFVDGKEVRP